MLPMSPILRHAGRTDQYQYVDNDDDGDDDDDDCFDDGDHYQGRVQPSFELQLSFVQLQRCSQGMFSLGR